MKILAPNNATEVEQIAADNTIDTVWRNKTKLKKYKNWTVRQLLPQVMSGHVMVS